jgi:Flp pilus assembly pilin Flp
MLNKNRGFSVIEYGLLIAIVAAGLIAAAVYLKRGIMGKWRQAGDTFGQGRQFDPKTTAISP